jgi:hypothetical protein
MKKFVQLCTILSLFLASCSMPKIAVLQPQIPAQYVDKEGFATQKSDSLDVTFGYLFSTKDHLVFEVSVKNNSADSVLIEPQDFSFQTASNVDSTLLSAPFKAQSFTDITHTWDERAREKNIKTAIVVLAVIATVIAIERSSNKTFNRNDFSYSVNTGVDLSFNFFDAMIYNHLSKKEAKRGLERSFMFPKKIGKSESHIGAVYFPRFDNAQKLLFNFKVGNSDFKTLFNQKIQFR